MHYRKIDYFRRFCALSHEHFVLEQNIDLSRNGLVQLSNGVQFGVIVDIPNINLNIEYQTPAVFTDIHIGF